DLADDSPIEDTETVVDRIRNALRYIEADRLIVAPDCGMKYLPRDKAFGKLSALARAAAKVRFALAGR
ncbi:MAG: 5-methyltetrahydropteroyltriglutamate--homocysteine methyltransferase, partial [Chloroflexi bacterium]